MPKEDRNMPYITYVQTIGREVCLQAHGVDGTVGAPGLLLGDRANESCGAPGVRDHLRGHGNLDDSLGLIDLHDIAGDQPGTLHAEQQEPLEG